MLRITKTRFPKAKPQQYKNPDGFVWRSIAYYSNGSSGYLPNYVCNLLKPTMENPEGSPTGLWYKTKQEAIADLRRVENELNA